MLGKYHEPVLLDEVIRSLNPSPGRTYFDGTIGGGGHAQAVLKALKGKGLLIGIDRDEEAIAAARVRLIKHKKNLTLFRGNFADIKSILSGLKIGKVDGILLDLGVSSHQIDEAQRGFSIRNDGPLDMRMDKDQKLTASDIVNIYSAADIAKIIFEFGEERLSRKISRYIVEQREKKPFRTTRELTDAIKASLGRIPPKRIFDAVTRVFQALRIIVNDEISSLSRALNDSIELLNSHGRIVVISYHSLEDRIVKNAFRENEKVCVCPKEAPVCTCGKVPKLKVLTRKPVMASGEEVSANPRSRSAKLRAAERI